mmetsp:Transcript_11950/g.25684  ORF Transcript_11950/g.25684 Transcript_11950/m.25684 type:complete len:158 (+) Transcript_11950:74-547(+)
MAGPVVLRMIPQPSAPAKPNPWTMMGPPNSHQWQQGGGQQWQQGGGQPGQPGGGSTGEGGNPSIKFKNLGKKLAHLHPAIKAFTKEYHAKFQGCVLLWKMLGYMNKPASVLPMLPWYTKDGESRLCFMHILGYCGRGSKCNFDHADAAWFPDGWAQH